MTVRLITADVREALATLPDASVHAVVTSPPYYALRSYQTEPQVWGGDDPDCPHDWQSERRYVEGGGNQRSSEAFHAPGEMNAARLKATRWKHDDTCQRCGAWRGELGQERTLADFIAHLVEVFRAVRRVLRPDGVCFINLGDSYAAGGNGPRNAERWPKQSRNAHGFRNVHGKKHPGGGIKPKDLMMVPSRLAIALQDDGWYLRSAITWCKTSAMPESVTDRPTTATEMIYMLTKSPRYFYDPMAVRAVPSGANGVHPVDELGGIERPTAAFGLTAQRGHVPSDDEFAPYLVLGALLGSERVFGKEWHDDFREFLDVLKNPSNGVVELLWQDAMVDSAAKVLLDVAHHLGVVVAELNLDTKPELLAGPSVVPAIALHDDEAALAIEQAREVVAKVVSNAKILRQTFPLDALAERLVDIDAIHQAVALFDCADALPGGLGNRGVAQTFLKHAAFGLAQRRNGQRAPVVRHNGPPLSSSIAREGANLRNYWIIGPDLFPGAHFAVFPKEIARRCVLLATSEKGCCPECGAPWVRVVERTAAAADHNGSRFDQGKTATHQNGTMQAGERFVSVPTGWQPSCACDAGDPVPCTVMDPFSGSGTTGLVADRLGRNAILIDINDRYVAMAKERITGDAPLFTSVEVA